MGDNSEDVYKPGDLTALFSGGSSKTSSSSPSVSTAAASSSSSSSKKSGIKSTKPTKRSSKRKLSETLDSADSSNPVKKKRVKSSTKQSINDDVNSTISKSKVDSSKDDNNNNNNDGDGAKDLSQSAPQWQPTRLRSLNEMSESEKRVLTKSFSHRRQPLTTNDEFRHLRLSSAVNSSLELKNMFSGVGGNTLKMKKKQRSWKTQMEIMEIRRVNEELRHRTLFVGNLPAWFRIRDVRNKVLKEHKDYIENIYLSNYCKGQHSKKSSLRMERLKRQGKRVLTEELQTTLDTKNNMNAWIVFSERKYMIPALKLNGTTLDVWVPTKEFLTTEAKDLRKQTDAKHGSDDQKSGRIPEIVINEQDPISLAVSASDDGKGQTTKEKKKSEDEEKKDSIETVKEESSVSGSGKPGKILKKFTLRVDYADSSTQRIDEHCVFVGGLGLQYTEEEVRKHFEHCGGIVNVRILRDPRSLISRGCGFVEFENLDGVCKALDLHRSRFLGDSSAKLIRVVPYQQGSSVGGSGSSSLSSSSSSSSAAHGRGDSSKDKSHQRRLAKHARIKSDQQKEKERLTKELLQSSKNLKNSKGKPLLSDGHKTAEQVQRKRQKRGRDENMKKLRWRDNPEMRIRSKLKMEKRSMLKGQSNPSGMTAAKKKKDHSKKGRMMSKSMDLSGSVNVKKDLARLSLSEQLEYKKAKILGQQKRWKHKQVTKEWTIRREKKAKKNREKKENQR